MVTANDPFHSSTGVSVYVSGVVRGLLDYGYDARCVWIKGTPNSVQFAADVQRTMPDIVHIHDLINLPMTFIPTMRKSGTRVAVTLHDFWPFCRRLLLVRPTLEMCFGSDGGHNCARYCSGDPTGRLTKFAAFLPGGENNRMTGTLRAGAAVYRRLRGRQSSQFVVPKPLPAGRPTEVETLQGEFATRERAYQTMLQQADLILTVSNFAKHMFVKHGYPGERLEVLPIATPSMNVIHWQLHRFRGYPIRFGFVGQIGPFKGAHVLAEAVRTVPPERAVFSLHGSVRPEDVRFLRNLAGAKPALRFPGPFRQEDLPGILADLDVLIFPSMQQETLGLAGLEAQAGGLPIIGAAAGAIPEYVRHEVNGLLFRPGDWLSLRAQIERVIEHPELIAQLSSQVPCPKTLSQHLVDLMSIYQRLHQVVMSS